MRIKHWPPNRNHWRAFSLLRLGMLVLLSAIPADGAFQQRRPFPPPAQNPPANQLPAVLSIRLDDGRVTANISNSPLQTVLKDLAERTGIIFEVRSQEDPLVSVHLNGVTLEEAIERITPGYNTIFLYDKDPQPKRITMVQVFPRVDSDVQPGIAYLGTGAVTKTNDSLENAAEALSVLAESDNVEVKEKAIELLVGTRGEEAVKALIEAVSDPATEIRVAAIEGLAALNAQAALPSILTCLKDRQAAVRQSAATAIALLGTAQNLQDLRPLSKDKDAGVAAAADTAIRKLSTSIKK